MHTPGHVPPRYDYAVRIEGPLAGGDPREADHLWRLGLWTRVPAAAGVSTPAPRRDPARPAARRASSSATTSATAVTSRTPTRRRSRRQRENRDRERVFFSRDPLPPRAGRGGGARRARGPAAAGARRIRAAALRVARAVRFAARCGREIYEYHQSFLHAKVAVVDGRWATVGSSNIDPDQPAARARSERDGRRPGSFAQEACARACSSASSTARDRSHPPGGGASPSTTACGSGSRTGSRGSSSAGSATAENTRGNRRFPGFGEHDRGCAPSSRGQTMPQ